MRKLFNLKREKGSVVIIAAVVFTVVAGLTGMVVDLGTVYMEGSAMQNAADSAVYSAQYDMPVSTGDSSKIAQIKSTATNYVIKNGIEAESIQSVVLGDAMNGQYTSLRVVLYDQVPYGFGQIFGLKGAVVTKSAKMAIESKTSSEDMVPLGIPVDGYEQAIAYDGAQNVIIKYGGGDGETGFFGAIDLDGVKGGGAQDFESWLAFGYGGTLNIGEELPIEPGNMAGPTADAFTIRYSQCTHGGCTVDNFDANCSRIIYIILYTLIDNQTIRVEGFAPFILQGIDENGEVIASHVNVYSNEGSSTTLTLNNINSGLYRPRLVE